MHGTTLICAVALLATAAASAVCRDEYLVSLTNSSQGIKVALLPRDNSPYKQAIETVTIRNQFLSPECGDNYFRCKDLTVVRKQSDPYSRQHVILVPIRNGILIMELRYNGLQLTLGTYHILDSPTCSPTAFFETSGTIFTVCLTLETRYLTLLELHLNTESIHSTHVSGPLLTFNQLQDPPEVSNFVFTALDSDSESKFIYFSTGSHVQIILPFVYLHYQGQVMPRCSKANTLVLANTLTMVAYCENTVVYYSIFENKLFNQTLYSESGRPFLCPDQDAHLSVFASSSYIEYGLWNKHSLEYFDIADGFDMGVCFGSAVNRTLFAYSTDDGVSVLEPFSSTITPVFSRSPRCSGFKFEPIMVFDDRYIVVREKAGTGVCDASVTVVDSQQNYSVAITGGHIQADLLTMVIEETTSHLVCDQISPEPTDVPDGQELESEDQSTVDAAVAIGAAIAGSFVVIILMASVVAILVFHRWRNNYSKRIVALSTVIANETADHDMEEVIPAQEETSSASRLEGSSQNAKHRGCICDLSLCFLLTMPRHMDTESGVMVTGT